MGTHVYTALHGNISYVRIGSLVYLLVRQVPTYATQFLQPVSMYANSDDAIPSLTNVLSQSVFDPAKFIAS